MPSKCLKIPKALWGFAHFWEFCSTLHGGSKNFFLRKVSKNKAEFNFELSETTFSGFSTFNTGNGPLVIWPCLKMLKIFETGFEIWCAKTAFGLLSAYLFVFGEFIGPLHCKKKIGTGCDPLTLRNLANSTQIVLTSTYFGWLWTISSRIKPWEV